MYSEIKRLLERSPPETEGCEFESQPSHTRSHTKDLKNGNWYTQLSAKLESDINKPGRWLSGGCCVNETLGFQNKELNALYF